jgi:hypothetical protein
MRDVGQPFLAADPLSSGSSRLKVGSKACGAWLPGIIRDRRLAIENQKETYQQMGCCWFERADRMDALRGLFERRRPYFIGELGSAAIVPLHGRFYREWSVCGA